MASKPLRIAVIAAHPRSRSFTMSAARAFAEAAVAAGAEVTIRDLYRLNFDPRLRAGELPDHQGFSARPDVRRERAALAGSDVFAFFHPLWFNSAPAMMKGYVDRVFGMGFGYSASGLEGNQPLLGGKRLVVFTSTGAPQQWVQDTGVSALQAQGDRHLAAVTGLDLIGHHNFGGLTPSLRSDVARVHLDHIRNEARRIVRARA